MSNSERWKQLSFHETQRLSQYPAIHKNTMVTQESPENTRPRLHWDHAFAETSDVAYPRVLDMRNSEEVFNLVSAFVREEAEFHPDYFGAIIFGSLSRGDTTNASDIDLYHVFRSFDPLDPLIPSSQYVRVLESIGRTFHQLYDIEVSSGAEVLALDNLEDLDREYFIHSHLGLNRDSLFILKDQAVTKKIHHVLRPDEIAPLPYESKNHHPRKKNTPHILNLDRLFHLPPWELYRSHDYRRRLFGTIDLS